MRIAGGLVLVAAGAVSAWYGWTIVDTIWGPGDSPDWAYLMFGLPPIAVGICCFVGAAVVVWRGRAPHP